jgi:periplasmic protein TonB
VNKALLYRPGSKRSFALAFAFAAGIHLSAIALAARHHDLPFMAEPFTYVDVETPLEETPSAPPIDIPLPPPPPSVVPADFVESQPPPPRNPVQRPRGPIRTPGLAPTVSKGNFRTYALSAPRPEYPYEARSRHIMGSGMARLTVDPASGSVVEATMQRSIGNPLLDHSALSAFRRWRFRPGTPATVIIPITYDLAGASY